MNSCTQHDAGCNLLNRTIEIRLCGVILKSFGSLMSTFLYQSTKYNEPQGIHCIYTCNWMSQSRTSSLTCKSRYSLSQICFSPLCQTKVTCCSIIFWFLEEIEQHVCCVEENYITTLFHIPTKQTLGS